MSHILKVTLVQIGPDWFVDVDEQGNPQPNHVDRDPNPQTISWHLSGNAYQGSFSTSSLAWQNPPPKPGTFDDAIPTPQGKHLNMTDNHVSSSTAGTWIYQLSFKIGSKKYSTLVALASGGKKKGGVTSLTVTNPTIKNN
jgi:hypothetical protein